MGLNLTMGFWGYSNSQNLIAVPEPLVWVWYNILSSENQHFIVVDPSTWAFGSPGKRLPTFLDDAPLWKILIKGSRVTKKFPKKSQLLIDVGSLEMVVVYCTSIWFNIQNTTNNFSPVWQVQPWHGLGRLDRGKIQPCSNGYFHLQTTKRERSGGTLMW